MNTVFRAATVDDLAHLAIVEQRAANLFPAGRLPDRSAVMRKNELQKCLQDEMLFVATAKHTVIGFAAGQIEQGFVWLLEMSVDPEHGRKGVGGKLLGQVLVAGVRRGCSDIVLTTFADLPWNAPFYARHGFMTLPEEQAPVFLQQALEQERQAGLTSRVAMQRSLDQARR